MNELKLFSVFNVPVYMRASAILLSVWLGIYLGFPMALAVLTILLVHEFGHVLAAKHYGYQTESVVLFGAGAVANIVGDLRRHELEVAFAGPAANFMLGILCFAAAYALKLYSPTSIELTKFVANIALFNVTIGLFNLIPIYPLDGGRVIRGILVGFLKFDTATIVTCVISACSLIAFGAYALITHSWLLLAIDAYVAACAYNEFRAALQSYRFNR